MATGCEYSQPFHNLSAQGCDPQGFATRLQKRRKKLRYSQKQLGEAIETSTTAIQRYESGRIPNGQNLFALSKALNCSMDWLLSGKKEMNEQESDETQKSQKHDPELRMVPKVLARLNAGGGSLETSENVQGMYGFRYDWIKTKGDPSKMVLMDVSGDSMTPEIRDGDTVLIDQDQKDVFVGKIYAVSIDQEIVVKYVEKLPGKLVLRSVNRRWNDIEVDIRGDLGDSVQIIGRVVWLGRELA